MTETQEPTNANERPRAFPSQPAVRVTRLSDGSFLFLESAPMPDWPGRALYCFSEPVPVGSFHGIYTDFISEEGCDAADSVSDPDGHHQPGA